MLQILNSILDVFNSIIDFVVSFFTDLVNIGKMLAEVSTEIPSYLGMFLPGPVISLVVVGISIAVIFKIAGREG